MAERANEPELVRLNKALAEAGLCSRRRADELLQAGKVKVNGAVAGPGLKIDRARDRIEVEGRVVAFSRAKEPIYLAFHKPVQVVTTAEDPQGRTAIFDLLPAWVRKERLFSVGRLDYFSEGLLLLTNDGELAHRLTHPSWHAAKRYRVLVREKPSEAAVSAMRKGMTLAEGERLAPVTVLSVAPAPGKGFALELELIQGVNRQIRRMCRDLGLTVLKLVRLSHGPVELGRLAPGKYRELRPDEVGALRACVGLAPPTGRASDRGAPRPGPGATEDPDPSRRRCRKPKPRGRA